jgi:transcriptional regulator with XRE-family HTH domain
MISQKIKAVRELLDLTETQISNIIYMNSYKYKKCEINEAYLSIENVLLLSIAYKIPLSELIHTQYTVEDILRNDYLNYLKEFKKKDIEVILKDNLCSYFVPPKKKLNYTTIDLLLRNERKSFATRLKNIRQEKQLELQTIVNLSELTISEYRNFESGFSFPNPDQLVRLSKILEVSLIELICN